MSERVPAGERPGAGPALDLEAVYRREGDRLWRALVGFTGDPDVAEDAVSEAFAQALGRGGQIRDPAAWVWRAAFRIAAGELHRRRRRPASSLIGTGPELLDGSHEDPEPTTDMLRALASLSRNQRGAILLFHYAGYPVKDVAQILGSTSAAVRMHLVRGRRRLRVLLEDPGNV